MMQGTDAAQEAMTQRGELPPGAHIGIQREGVTLLYTAVDATYHDVVTEYPLVQETAPRYRRAGINLASHALTLLRVPEVIDRVRQAPYPRLHVLLDAIGDAEVKFDDHDDWRFVLPGFGGQLRPLRLDEIPLTATPSQARTGTHNSILPARPQTDSATVQDVLSSVDTAARAAFTIEDMSLGESGVPAVLFEPMQAVARTSPNGQTSEVQAEMIITAGFTRFLPDLDRAPKHLPDWSLRRTDTGLELWDAGGIWARGALNLDHGWLAAAEHHGVVVVIYGAQIGVRAPMEISIYTDGHRHTELMESRRPGRRPQSPLLDCYHERSDGSCHGDVRSWVKVLPGYSCDQRLVRRSWSTLRTGCTSRGRRRARRSWAPTRGRSSRRSGQCRARARRAGRGNHWHLVGCS